MNSELIPINNGNGQRSYVQEQIEREKIEELSIQIIDQQNSGSSNLKLTEYFVEQFRENFLFQRVFTQEEQLLVIDNLLLFNYDQKVNQKFHLSVKKKKLLLSALAISLLVVGVLSLLIVVVGGTYLNFTNGGEEKDGFNVRALLQIPFFVGILALPCGLFGLYLKLMARENLKSEFLLPPKACSSVYKKDRNLLDVLVLLSAVEIAAKEFNEEQVIKVLSKGVRLLSNKMKQLQFIDLVINEVSDNISIKEDWKELLNQIEHNKDFKKRVKALLELNLKRVKEISVSSHEKQGIVSNIEEVIKKLSEKIPNLIASYDDVSYMCSVLPTSETIKTFSEILYESLSLNVYQGYLSKKRKAKIIEVV